MRYITLQYKLYPLVTFRGYQRLEASPEKHSPSKLDLEAPGTGRWPLVTFREWLTTQDLFHDA
jgi:hypothetical protein